VAHWPLDRKYLWWRGRERIGDGQHWLESDVTVLAHCAAVALAQLVLPNVVGVVVVFRGIGTLSLLSLES